jgi:hypothetical protein
MTFPTLSRPVRRANLVLHVAVSVGWLGMDAVLLVLGGTAALTGDPDLTRACYLAMDAAGGAMLVPVALLTLLTGLVAGLGTQWGLVRYWWVLAKLVLTLVAATASIVLLRAHLAAAAAEARLPLPDLGRYEQDLVVPPTVALVLYTTMVVLSVVKPWGRTGWGRRAAAAPRRSARSARSAQSAPPAQSQRRPEPALAGRPAG